MSNKSVFYTNVCSLYKVPIVSSDRQRQVMMPMPILYLRLLVQIDLNDHLIFTMAESSLLRLYLLRFLVTAYLQFWKMQVFW